MAGRGTPPPDEWTRRTSRTIGRILRRYRRDRGIEVAALSAQTELLGHTVPTQVIHNMELGRRANIPITDILVLAAALNVPPVLLVFPIEPPPEQTSDRAFADFPTTFEPTPGREVVASRALAEFCGEASPETNHNGQIAEQWRRSAAVLANYRLHNDLIDNSMSDGVGRQGARATARHEALLQQLAVLREQMRGERLTLPDLPEALGAELKGRRPSTATEN